MKILSLDGGGSWALVQAKCLAKLYGKDIPGHELLREFDMVIANSGGSMVLAALVAGKTPQQIIDWFNNEKVRKSIFVRLSFWQRPLLISLARLLNIGPKYAAEAKLSGLRENLGSVGDLYLSQIPAFVDKESLQIMICGFDYDRNREVFFRSNRHSRADSLNIEHRGADPSAFNDVTLAEAVHAASNAPVNYFDEPANVRYKGKAKERRFWDGAVGGYNNPVLAALIESICDGKLKEDLKILSIGTGSQMLPLLRDQDPEPRRDLFLYEYTKAGFASDIKKIAGSILSDPPDSASFHTWAILHPDLPKESTQFFRFSPLIKPYFDKGWRVPKGFTPEEFEDLINLDMDAVEQEEVALISQLCKEWMNPDGEIANQAIRYNSRLEPLIGYGSFATAKAAFDVHFKESVVA